MSNLVRLLRALQDREVRYVAIGVWGVNFYAEGATELFATQDTDLFVPPDAQNLLLAWEACDALGLELTCSGEPLDQPRDLFVARAVVERHALTRAMDESDLLVDFTLVMAGFDFEAAWKERRIFSLDGVGVSVARLGHIVHSKRMANRPKDLLFLESYREVLEDLQRRKGKPFSAGDDPRPEAADDTS